MPIYEYVCQSCQHRFEAKQKVSDAPLSSCPRCGGAVVKVISAPAIMFKGSGWYVTDYSDKLKAPADAQPATAKEGNGKPDQKPATATPAPASGEKSEGTKPAKSDNTSGSSTGTGSGGGTTPATPASSSPTPSS